MSHRLLILAVSLCMVTASASAQFWETTDGPPASVTCLISDSEGRVFAGTPFSAVYRTTDLGATWTRLDKGIDDGGANFYPVGGIAVGANDELFAAVNGQGILRSRNHGDTWEKLDILIEVTSNSRLSVTTELLDGGQAASVFVGYDGGAANLHLRLSENSGDSFVEIPKSNLPSAMSSIFETFLSPNSDKMFILVSYNKGLYRSSNKGATWTRIDSDPSSGESDDNFLTMRAAPDGTLFIGRNALPGSTKSPNAVVMRSKNDGESWEYLLEGWDNRDITNNRITGIAFGPDNHVWVITALSSGVFFSSNGGDSWISQNDGLPSDGSGNGIAVTKNEDVFVAPTGSAVHRHLVTTSVSDVTPHVVRNVAMAPNPARDQVFVTVDMEVTGPVSVEMFSSQGTSVAAPFNNVLNAGTHSLTMSTSSLPNGMYYWVVRSGQDVRTGKVCILR